MLPIFEDTSPIPTPQSTSQPLVESRQTKPQAIVADKTIEKVKPLRSETLLPLGVSVRLGAKSKSADDEKTNNVAEEVASYGNAPIQQAELQLFWDEFANAQEAFLQQTLSHSNPRLKAGTTILITLENTFQRDKINEIKSKLVPFLRSKLKNDAILLEIEITAALESTKAFTPKEKLELMMKDNPALVRLIDALDLEMD